MIVKKRTPSTTEWVGVWLLRWSVGSRAQVGGRQEAPGNELVRDTVQVVFSQDHPVVLAGWITFAQVVEVEIMLAARVDFFLGEGQPSAFGLAETDDVPGRCLGFAVAKDIPEAICQVDDPGLQGVLLACVSGAVDDSLHALAP